MERTSVNIIRWLSNLYCETIPLFFIMVFFTNIIIYFPDRNLIPLQPFQIVILFFILSIPFLLKQNKYQTILSNKVFIWTIFYWLISFVFFVFSSAQYVTSIKQFKTISIAVLVIISGIIIFNHSTIQRVRMAILIATLISIFLNFYDFLNPFSIDFLDPFSISDSVGRSAGMYLNPNIAALAILTGLILSIGIIKKKILQILYFTLVGIAVTITFSRAGLLSFTIVFFSFCYYYKINPFYLIFFFIITVLSIYYFDIYDIQYLTDSSEMTILLDRINIFGEGSATDDFSSFERKKLLEKGISVYLENPIFGVGVGGGHEISGAEYSNQSTHNQFVFLLVEYGVIGFVIIIMYFRVISGKIKRSLKSFEVGSFLIIFFLNCFFSHNMFETYFLLVTTPIIPLFVKNKQT